MPEARRSAGSVYRTHTLKGDFFEISLAMQWQAITLFARLMAQKRFEKGDGSKWEKLNKIYNASKHYDPATLSSKLLHAVWITNEGLNIEGCTFSFSEIEDLLYEVGELADMVSSCDWQRPNPSA